MFLLCDIGGTNTRIATGEGGHILDNILFETKKDFEAEGVAIASAAKKILKNEKPEKIICGIPGLLNKERTSLLSAPNLSDWVGLPIKQRLEELLETPVLVQNDAALGALGEAVYGAGKDYGIVAYITVGTGVGGARIVNKTIDEASLGFEPGHQIIDTVSQKTLEDLIGGKEIAHRYGKNPAKITDGVVWDEAAKNLSFGLLNISALWSPDVFVLGGSMIRKSPGIRIDDIKKHMNQITQELDVPIVLGTLGDECGLWGALSLAQ